MVDQDGILVRPGARMVPRKTSVVSGVMGSSEPKVVPPENRCVMLKTKLNKNFFIMKIKREFFFILMFSVLQQAISF